MSGKQNITILKGPYDTIRPNVPIYYISHEPQIVVRDHEVRGQEEKTNILTIADNSCEELQLDGEEIISYDFPLEALGLAFDPLVDLWWCNLCQVLVPRLPVRNQFRTYGWHSGNFQVIGRHGLQSTCSLEAIQSWTYSLTDSDLTLTNSGIRAAHGCPLQPSKNATRNFS